MIAQLVGLGVVLISVLALVAYGMGQQSARASNVRAEKLSAVPPFRAYAHEVGRVAEEGANIHVALGSGDFLSESGMVGIAALQGLSNMLELSAAYDTPPLISVGDPTLYLVADNQLRDAYARLGNAQDYQPGFVRYIPSTPIVYAAMAATHTFDEPIGTQLNLGNFGGEAALLTDAAGRKNIKVLGGTVSPEGIAAMLSDVAPDQLIMGEQLFAGGAETSQRSAFWASLRVENVLRWLVVGGILLTLGAQLLGIGG